MATNLRAQDVLSAPVSLSISEGNIQAIIENIERENVIFISYSSNYLNDSIYYSLSNFPYTYASLFYELLRGQDLEAVGRKGKILLIPKKRSNTNQSGLSIEVFTVNGYVKDIITGEFLIGASVYSPILKQGTATNEMGYYSLDLPKGKHVLNYSYIGFQAESIDIDLNRSLRNDVELSYAYATEEIIVIDRDTSELYRKWNFTRIEDIENYPGLLGEDDPVQSIQMLTGIQSGNETQGGLYVRGSGYDQNLILMDGIPVFEPKHFFGIVSIFNEDAINQMDVYKGGFAPKYGGRLSSVIDIHLSKGNKSTFHANAKVGLLGAKIHLEGPVIKEKSSFSFSARSSWINYLLNPLAKDFFNLENSDFRYYDVNFKYHHIISPINQISFSTYIGNDLMYYEDKSNEIENLEINNSNTLRWGNRIYSFRWSRILGSKLFMNTTIGAVQYNNSSRLGLEFKILSGDSTSTPSYEAVFRSKIKDVQLKTDLNYYFSNTVRVNFGLGYSNQSYNAGIKSSKFIFNGTVDELFEGDPVTRVQEFSAYFQHQYNPIDRLSFSTGLRLADRFVEDQFYLSLEPRFNINVVFPWQSTLDMNYTRMSQFIHLLVNPGLGLPSDLWVPSTNDIKPEIANQFAIAYTQFLPFDLAFSAEAYYKRLYHQLDYQSAYDILSPVINDVTTIPIFVDSRDWESRVVSGDGISSGFEFALERYKGRLKGKIGYTYGNSDRQFDQINDGISFPYNLDRRHDLSTNLKFELSKNFDLAAMYIYGSGHPFTLALEEYVSIDNEIIYILNADSRNNQRLPAYKRLDLSMHWHKAYKSYQLDFNFGIYNLLNRKNPYYVYLAKTPDKNEYKLKQVSILPVLPFLNFQIKI
jgi:hypothetical protein